MRKLLQLIRFSHTLFALPFALMAMLVATGGMPENSILAWILVCLVGARTAAMAFNRWADWELDKKNPRTAGRQHLATPGQALLLCIAGLIVFGFGCWHLGPLCRALYPVAVLLTLGYSLAKRWTAYSHFLLGLALAAAPMGAWAAVRGELFSPAPWMLAAGVALWVFGFDLIYAAQDADFDRTAGLRAYPARHGIPAALRLAQLLHTAAWTAFAAFGILASLHWPYAASLLIAGGALIYEHRVAQKGHSSSDLAQINHAFFHVNAAVGILLLIGTAASLWM